MTKLLILYLFVAINWQCGLLIKLKFRAMSSLLNDFLDEISPDSDPSLAEQVILRLYDTVSRVNEYKRLPITPENSSNINNSNSTNNAIITLDTLGIAITLTRLDSAVNEFTKSFKSELDSAEHRRKSGWWQEYGRFSGFD